MFSLINSADDETLPAFAAERRAAVPSCGAAAAAVGGGVMVNFDLGEWLPRPRSQQLGSLLGMGAGRGRR